MPEDTDARITTIEDDTDDLRQHLTVHRRRLDDHDRRLHELEAVLRRLVSSRTTH